MKKLLTVILLIVVIFTLSACKATPKDINNKLQIVTTTFAYYDFARNVAGDKADVTLLLQPGTEAHSYEPTPQDIIKIKECDLFIRTGMEMDPWADAVINDADGKNINVLSAMECVRPLYGEYGHNDHGQSVDSHVWTSPENAEEIVDEIAQRLCRIDPKNRNKYERNEEIYSEKLEKLDDKFERITEKRNKKPIAFADRFALRYFADEYNLEYYSAFPGCSTEGEASAASVANLIDIVKEYKIPVVFYSETSNGQMPDAIASETGAVKKLFHTCHTVTKQELENGVTYIDLMQNNYDALKQALK